MEKTTLNRFCKEVNTFGKHLDCLITLLNEFENEFQVIYPVKSED